MLNCTKNDSSCSGPKFYFYLSSFQMTEMIVPCRPSTLSHMEGVSVDCQLLPSVTLLFPPSLATNLRAMSIPGIQILVSKNHLPFEGKVSFWRNGSGSRAGNIQAEPEVPCCPNNKEARLQASCGGLPLVRMVLQFCGFVIILES